MSADKLQASMVALVRVSAHPSNIGRDLGDLRTLAESISVRGVLVPLVVERNGDGYRLRDGHRRLAAAKIAGRSHAPALIHTEALGEADWLLESVEYNVRRKGYSAADRRRVVSRLVELGVTRKAIGEAFGCSAASVTRIVDSTDANRRRGDGRDARARAVKRLIAAHRDEYDELLREEGLPRLALAEDVGDLLAAGESVHAIADRMGLSVGGVARSLRRAGDPNYRAFNAAAEREQRSAR